MKRRAPRWKGRRDAAPFAYTLQSRHTGERGISTRARLVSEYESPREKAQDLVGRNLF